MPVFHRKTVLEMDLMERDNCYLAFELHYLVAELTNCQADSHQNLADNSLFIKK